MNQLRIGLLVSNHAAMSLSPRALGHAAQQAGRALGRPLLVETIDVETMTATPEVDLLISATAPLFHEPTWAFLHDYFRRGGHLLSIGCDAFTVPYTVRDGRIESAPRTDAALHALELIDTHISTGPFNSPAVCDVSLRFSFLQEIGLPDLSQTGSMDVRLATTSQPDEPQYARHGVREARCEVACTIRDDTGRAVAAPLIRIDRFTGGSLTFANLRPVDERFFESHQGHEFLAHLLASSLKQAWLVQAHAGFARYLPEEPVEVHVSLRRLSGSHEHAKRQLVLTLHEAGDVGRPPLMTQRYDTAAEDMTFSWPTGKLAEGCYVVRSVLELDGQPIEKHDTGFYVLSDDRARDMACRAPRLGLDPSIAPDYCIVDGHPFPMTGSTYMAPDNYRDCFSRLNVVRARSDLAALKRMGVNIIRSGVWVTYGLIYDPAGGFREQALRSMDAYFLAAAEVGLPVQFVPSAFVMNCWDRQASAFHDPHLRGRVMKCFEQFARRYAGWPGIQLDIINEPSYSPFKHGLLWQLARPIGDPHELQAWREWLRIRYDDNAARLRAAWGVTQPQLRDFTDATLPDDDEFVTNYDGAGRYTLRTKLADFYSFADDTFTDWVREIREIVRREAPDMLVMVGRDETIRVPAQQRDTFEGNVDLVNWHQWHREGVIFNEYVLNRVRGVPCCGQEMGVLCYKDQRNEERLSEVDLGNQLERKLVYCLGNWIQWQSHSDPIMDCYKENKLGMIRLDGTERPAAELVRLLAWLERSMSDRLVGRREDLERLALVVPTSLWFSSDSHLAYRAASHAIIALHYHLKQPAYAILESLLRPDNLKQIGSPAVVLLPSPTLLRDDAWEFLLGMVRDQGMRLLVTGSPQQDPFWARRDRLSQIGLSCEVGNLAAVEQVRIAGRTHYLTFREALRLNVPAKVLLRAVPAGTTVCEPIEIPHGRGKVVYCPMPVELADSIAPTVDLYRHLLSNSPDLPPATIEVDRDHDSPAHFIYPIAYRDCTAVSLVNEGTDATMRFTVQPSGCRVAVRVDAGRAAKLYVDHSGGLVGGYIHGPVETGSMAIHPGGDLAVARHGERWHLLAGRRRESPCTIDGQSVPVRAFQQITL